MYPKASVNDGDTAALDDCLTRGVNVFKRYRKGEGEYVFTASAKENGELVIIKSSPLGTPELPGGA